MTVARGTRPMGHRILVLDDEQAILFAIRDFFAIRGDAVDCARDLGEAEALLGRGSYDVVISDLRLAGSEGAEGLELLSMVRERRPGTRTILLTAYGSPEIEAEARRRGADAFLHKPQPLPELARIVDRLAAT